MTLSLPALKTRALVLDIEGTTTPVSFVYDVLFPYARSHVAAYLQRERQSPQCRESIARLGEERLSDIAHGDLPPAAAGGSVHDFGPAEAVAYVHWLMDRDRKSPGLKTLQGLIWQDGFASGELKGRVYPDVPPAFARWRANARDIHIYSSGSVLAQRLLFQTTDAGDLTPFLAGHFDTAVGPKTSPDSYRQIAERTREAPAAMLFVSDVVAELDAARTAGLRTALCVRDAASPAPVSAHPVVRSFDELAEA